MRAILGGENKTQGIAVKAFGEGENDVSVKRVDIRGDSYGYPCHRLGDATEASSVARGEKRLEKVIFSV
jgi:hypothetical protein